MLWNSIRWSRLTTVVHKRVFQLHYTSLTLKSFKAVAVKLLPNVKNYNKYSRISLLIMKHRSCHSI